MSSWSKSSVRDKRYSPCKPMVIGPRMTFKHHSTALEVDHNAKFWWMGCPSALAPHLWWWTLAHSPSHCWQRWGLWRSSGWWWSDRRQSERFLNIAASWKCPPDSQSLGDAEHICEKAQIPSKMRMYQGLTSCSPHADYQIHLQKSQDHVLQEEW